MKRVSYLPHVPEEAEPEAPVTRWSYGIAMFAAFVLPFILLITSARYRLFADQAFLRLRGTSQEARRVSEDEAGIRPAISKQVP
jgi:hypothetical protein